MSTREQLEARWLTTGGKQVARELSQVLSKRTSMDILRQLTVILPYVEEVTPALDLRGLRIEGQDVEFVWSDFSGARLDVNSHN